MLGGRAADLFGRRRVFMIGLALFTVCSLLGGLAQSGGGLIAARAAQGIGGAILAPTTLSISPPRSPTRRAPPGARRLVGHRRERCRRRRARRRNPDRPARLAVGALRQRADRRRDAARSRAVSLTESRAAGLAAASTSPAPSPSPPGWPCSSTASSAPTPARGDRPQTMLTVRWAASAARRVSSSSRPVCRASPRAAQHLPAGRSVAAANGIAADHRGRAVRDVLLPLPLPPAGERVQPAQGRVRVPAGRAGHADRRRSLGTRIVTRIGARRQLVIGPLMAALAWCG